MTKVQVHLALTRPLDDKAMQAVANAHGYYGIYFVRVTPSLDKILVEYDASRLAEPEVVSALHRAGIPVQTITGPRPTPSETDAAPNRT